MPPTDVTEKGLETLIVERLTGRATQASPLRPGGEDGRVGEERGAYVAGGYVEGAAADYDRVHAVDTAKLLGFLRATQPKTVELLELDTNDSKRQQFLDRLRGEVAKRGVVDVLRKGIKHGPAEVTLFYGRPTPGTLRRRRGSRAMCSA